MNAKLTTTSQIASQNDITHLDCVGRMSPQGATNAVTVFRRSGEQAHPIRVKNAYIITSYRWIAELSLAAITCRICDAFRNGGDLLLRFANSSGTSARTLWFEGIAAIICLG
ncbi:hypothetical protein GCM10027088_45240 [Nocardia goodfellowii]